MAAHARLLANIAGAQGAGRWRGAAALPPAAGVHRPAGPAARLTTARRARERRKSTRGAAAWRRAPLPREAPLAEGTRARGRLLMVEACLLPRPKLCAERAAAPAAMLQSLRRANVVAGAPRLRSSTPWAGPARIAQKRQMHAPPRLWDGAASRQRRRRCPGHAPGASRTYLQQCGSNQQLNGRPQTPGGAAAPSRHSSRPASRSPAPSPPCGSSHGSFV